MRRVAEFAKPFLTGVILTMLAHLAFLLGTGALDACGSPVQLTAEFVGS